MRKVLRNTIQRIKSERAGRTGAEYRITWNDTMVRLDWLTLENTTGSSSFEWNAVIQVETFKRDFFSVDCICLAFRTRKGWIELNEDMQSWKPFLEAVRDRLPGFPALEEWYGKVMLPAFKRNQATLWVRDKKERPTQSETASAPRSNAFDVLFASCLAAFVMGLPFFILAACWLTQIRGAADNGAAIGLVGFVAMALFGTVLAAVFFTVAGFSWRTRENVVREHLFAWPLVVPVLMLVVGFLPAAAGGFLALLGLAGACLFCASFGILAAKLWLRLAYQESSPECSP